MEQAQEPSEDTDLEGVPMMYRVQREMTDFKLALVGKDKLQSMLDAKDWQDVRLIQLMFMTRFPFYGSMRERLWEATRLKKALDAAAAAGAAGKE